VVLVQRQPPLDPGLVPVAGVVDEVEHVLGLLVGDPGAVSDDLIEALAALLLSVETTSKEQPKPDQHPAAA
jgi:hypothetical protein